MQMCTKHRKLDEQAQLVSAYKHVAHAAAPLHLRSADRTHSSAPPSMRSGSLDASVDGLEDELEDGREDGREDGLEDGLAYDAADLGLSLTGDDISEPPTPRSTLGDRRSEGLGSYMPVSVEEVDDEDAPMHSDSDSDSDSDGDLPQHDAHFGNPARPLSPASVEEQDDDDELFEVQQDDPLYARLEALYGDDPVDNDPASSATALPPAFREHPLVRRAYIQAFISVAFYGATHDSVKYTLECARDQLLSMCLRTGYVISGLEKMAVTLRTVERRLGLDPDEHITYWALCNTCWETHHPSQLKGLPAHGRCLVEDCPGTVFEIKHFSDGTKHRVPVKVLSTVSPKEVIQRLVLRPGKLEEMGKWRSKPDDQPGEKAPVTIDDWPGSLDAEFRMYDITDGWGWNAIRAGLHRRKGGRWGIEDVDVDEVNQRYVTLPNGLVLIFNLDWYVLVHLVNPGLLMHAQVPRDEARKLLGGCNIFNSLQQSKIKAVPPRRDLPARHHTGTRRAFPRAAQRDPGYIYPRSPRTVQR